MHWHQLDTNLAPNFTLITNCSGVQFWSIQLTCNRAFNLQLGSCWTCWSLRPSHHICFCRSSCGVSCGESSAKTKEFTTYSTAGAYLRRRLDTHSRTPVCKQLQRHCAFLSCNFLRAPCLRSRASGMGRESHCSQSARSSKWHWRTLPARLCTLVAISVSCCSTSASCLSALASDLSLDEGLRHSNSLC